jgi:hypothetical protein
VSTTILAIFQVLLLMAWYSAMPMLPAWVVFLPVIIWGLQWVVVAIITALTVWSTR